MSNEVQSVSKARLLAELVIVGATFFLGSAIVGNLGLFLLTLIAPVFFSDLDLASAEAISIGTFLGLPIIVALRLLLIKFILQQRGKKLFDIGLLRPESWGKAALQGVLVAVVTEFVSILALNIVAFFGLAPDVSVFLDSLPGNTALYIYMVIFIAGFSAAFGEEVTHRGFMMQNIEGLFSAKQAWIFAAVIQAIIFGFLHIYQGLGGVIPIIAGAVLTGLFYYRFKNLWPLIFAHFYIDFFGITVLYLS